MAYYSSSLAIKGETVGMALNDMHTSRKRFVIDTNSYYLEQKLEKKENARILLEEKNISWPKKGLLLKGERGY